MKQKYVCNMLLNYVIRVHIIMFIIVHFITCGGVLCLLFINKLPYFAVKELAQ